MHTVDTIPCAQLKEDLAGVLARSWDMHGLNADVVKTQFEQRNLIQRCISLSTTVEGKGGSTAMGHLLDRVRRVTDIS